MINISYRMTFKDLGTVPILKPFKNYFIYGQGLRKFLIKRCMIGQFFCEGSSWNYDSFKKGIQLIDDASRENKQIIYPLIEKAKGHDKDVNLMYFPVKGSIKPFVLIIAGGGFTNICNLTEGFPIAKEFNDLGYPAFILNYHVCKDILMPRPMIDCSLGINYIYNHLSEFNLINNDYLVCGFSAGGTIAELWSTSHLGAPIYDLPRPSGVILGYPFTSVKYTFDNKEDNDTCKMVLGKNRLDSMNSIINTDENLDKDYPPTYIAYAKDDERVDQRNSTCLYDALQLKKIPSKIESHTKGGHGFGDGTATEFEGWIKRAVEFIERNKLAK